MTGLKSVLSLTALLVSAKATTCTYSSSGATFDLRPLMVTSQTDSSYYILDGDIPCTPETEPSYSYVFNFCAPVTQASLPGACKNIGKSGVALQYLQLADASDCYIIARDSAESELKYRLLDTAGGDPTKGVSLLYPTGEHCTHDPKDPTLRSTTVDVQCANTKTVVTSANSPGSCQFHLTVKSWYGCPTQCPVTGNGLCDSHGHCAYDSKSRSPYCFCNTGHYGNDCSSTLAPVTAKTIDGRSVQIGLLVTLLVVMLLLTGAVGFMTYKLSIYRKEAHYSALASSSSHGASIEMGAMVDTVSF